MINMNILAVVTLPSNYHGCSTRKTFWEEKFTSKEKFALGEFSSVNINNCGRHSVNKHREIKGGDNYITLDISLKLGSLYNMRITSSEPKDNLGGSRKWLITSLGIKAKAGTNKYK